MPSRDPQFSSAALDGVGLSMLKRHKTLPRPPKERFSEILPSQALKPRILAVDTGIPSSPTSQTSSPHTLKHSRKRIGVPDLPPTPPTHSRQSSGGNSFYGHNESQDEAPKSPSLPSTPTNHLSPPTPDVTPPRRTTRSVRARPSGSDKYLSSRNDSFKTAKEELSSEDGDEVSTVRPILPSARPSQAEVLQVPAKKLKSRDIGLGLGLESDHDSTPSPRARKSRDHSSGSRMRHDFAAFDGGWGSTEELTEVEPEWDHNLMRNVTVRKRRAREKHFYNDSQPEEVLDDYLTSPTNATKLLRRYPLLEPLNTPPLQNTATESLLLRGFLEESTPAQSESEMTPDVRRFSELSMRSGTSAVVEAMVVDTVPQRRQTLRHTKKQMGLREFSSDNSTHSSTVESIFSDQAAHRLVHKTSGIFSRRHHSLGSTPTTSTTSSAKSRREVWKSGSIPVVVVPERRSSVKSAHAPSLRSKSSSRHSKRSLSLNHAPLSQSLASESVSFELPKRSPRRLSEHSSLSTANSQRTTDFAPRIPVRRSSLSAPTSRNTSRAGSLTADSLKAHDMIQAEAQPVPSSENGMHLDMQNDTMTLSPPGIVDHNGDPFFGNRLSAQVTPFSQTSYETTCTAAELAQATSVTLHPHHNASVLVVEQQAQPVTSLQEDTFRESRGADLPLQNAGGDPAQTAERPQVKTIGMSSIIPVTPPQRQQQQEGEVDSPLKNPREAPQPPAIKFIPPTPNNLTPAEEEDRQLGDDYRPAIAPEKPKRGLSLLRRALSNRRRSESLISRTFSTKRSKDSAVEPLPPANGNLNSNTIYPSVMDQPPDESKLHPFWRPSSFWDDLEDDEYEDYFEPNPYPAIDNRPALPKRSFSDSLKRTFAILPIRDEIHPETYMPQRRVVQRSQSGSLRVVKNRSSNSSLRRALSDGRAYYVTEKSKIIDMDELGRAWNGVKGLGRRMSERRRERRNAQLRRSISGPKDAIDGVARVVGGDGVGRHADDSGTRDKGKARA